MKFITIDFETANANLDSVCSLGVVKVEDDKVTLKEFLINPNQPFSLFNVSIHNIKESDVVDAPTFDIVWNEIKSEFENTTIYAHNAQFDLAVLKACLSRYNLEIPNIKYGCSLQISRKLWKDELVNHRLSTITKFLEINHNHHNALSDAYACVEIIKRGMKVMRVDSDVELYNALGLRYKRVR